MKITIEKPVTVITPSIGKNELVKCVDSVAKQTYNNITHLIVSDGPEFFNTIITLPLVHEKLRITHIPENTGGGGQGFYGHRIYAAYPHLVNSDYVLFLDEDNFYEPNHVASLVKAIEDNNVEFSYSLRKIYDKNGNYLLDDNSESLGMWPVWTSRETKHYLVDTSSYCFRREFLIQCCHIWHWGWGADRRFYQCVRENRHATNGLHTLGYRLDGNPGSVTKEFFEQGNNIQLKKYGGHFPWIKRI